MAQHELQVHSLEAPSRLSTDEAANLRALPQAAPRSFEHPGHNWTANPSRKEMDLEE